MKLLLKYCVLLCIIVILINLVCICNSSGTTIVKSYATLKSDPKGLAWDGNFLWLVHEQDYGAEGLITKIDPDTGSIKATIPSPGSQPRGLAWGDGYLWIIDKQGGKFKLFKLDPDNYEEDVPTFTLDEYNIEAPVGLTYGGNHLWISDSSEGRIYDINLLEKSCYPITSPAKYPTDLAWDGRYLYVGEDNYKGGIYKLDTITGKYEKLDIPVDNPNVYGLAWDGNYLWMVDDYAEKIYGLEIESLISHSSKFYLVNASKSAANAPSIDDVKVELLDNTNYYVSGTVSDSDGINYVKSNGEVIEITYHLAEGTYQFGGVVNMYDNDFNIAVSDFSGETTLNKYQLIDSDNSVVDSDIGEYVQESDSSPASSAIGAIGSIIAAFIGAIAVISVAILGIRYKGRL
nr:hypothetical protein [uncultured Methanolobus sp.]